MKKFSLLSLLAVFTFCIGMAFSTTTISAADLTTYTFDSLSVVEDINIYTANYQLVSYQMGDKGVLLTVNIPEDGFIKIRTVASDYYGLSNSTNTPASVKTRLYRDTHYIDQIGPDVTATGSTVSDTQPLAVDKGTYYLALLSPKYTNINDKNTYFGRVLVAITYQKCPSQEMYQPSTPISRNVINFNEEFTGFMSDSNPIDYYEFTLHNKALVKFSYRTNTKGNTDFTLFNNDDETLLTQSYSGGYVWYNIEKYLEPGVYYCSFASSSRGSTGFKLTKTDYNLSLSYKLPYVKVATIDNVKEIRYVRGKLSNSELNGSKWYKGTALGEGIRKFGVNKAGYYTVRVTDTYDNMFMKTIYVKKVDKTKPGKVKVTSCKYTNSCIKGKAEKNSTVYAYVNGYTAYLYSAKVSSKGTFKLVIPGASLGGRVSIYAVDAAGNKGKITNVYWK